MSELQTLKCYLTQLPATILKLLNIDLLHNNIPDPVLKLFLDLIH